MQIKKKEQKAKKKEEKEKRKLDKKKKKGIQKAEIGAPQNFRWNAAFTASMPESIRHMCTGVPEIEGDVVHLPLQTKPQDQFGPIWTKFGV